MPAHLAAPAAAVCALFAFIGTLLICAARRTDVGDDPVLLAMMWALILSVAAFVVALSMFGVVFVISDIESPGRPPFSHRTQDAIAGAVGLLVALGMVYAQYKCDGW